MQTSYRAPSKYKILGDVEHMTRAACMMLALNLLEQECEVERCDTWRADWLKLELSDIARARKLLRRRRPRGLWRSEAFSDHMALHAHFTNRMRGSDSFTTV